jgi:hypothetical protein
MKYILFFFLVVLIACRNSPKTETVKSESPAATTPDSVVTGTNDPGGIVAVTTNSDSLVVATSRQVLTLMKNKAFSQLSGFFHPVQGVRFSPYGFVDTSLHRTLQAAEFLKAIDKKPTLYWGSYDGSGDSILLTAAAYYKKFIYNADFLNAEKSSLNKRISTGNSLNNIATVYPGSNYTEHYFSGFDKKYGGMDWTSLKLVFQFYEGKNYLVAIVHDQWTT